MFNKIQKLFFITLIISIFYMPHHLQHIKSIALPITYIKSIDTQEIPKQYVKFSLDYFNGVSMGTAVKYSGLRPIIIKEVSRNSFMYQIFKDRIAGLAHAGYRTCTIYLNPDLIQDGSLQVFTTVIHEYLHCLGFSHVDNTKDLMYYSSANSSQHSLYGYAESIFWSRVRWEIRKRKYMEFEQKVKGLWNNLKN